MKNRGNIRVPAAHSSIMSSKQAFAGPPVSDSAPACVYLCTRPVYLYMSPRTYTCMYIYARKRVCLCVCVRALAML